MTLYAWVNQQVLNGVPLTVVSRGVLSEDQEQRVGVTTHPYGLLYNLPDVELERFQDGSAQKARVSQVIIEARPVTSEDGLHIPSYELMLSWYDLLSDAPDHVDEIRKGVPLDRKLHYVGGLGEPEQKPGTKDWLIAGLDFEQVFSTRF